MADSTPVSFSLPPASAAGIAAAPQTLPSDFDLVYQSYVALNDGSVGVVLSYVGGVGGARTGKIVWGTCPTPAALFTPGSVTIGPTLMEQTAFNHVGFEASINRGPDGDLYLVVWVLREATLVPGPLPLPAYPGTYVYRSSDEGATWTAHGTVQAYTTSYAGGSFGGFGDTGEIYYSDTGRWIVPFGRIYNYFGASRGSTGIAVSDDFGATWTITLATSNAYSTASSRQIAYNTVDGFLYFCIRRSQNPNFRWLYSNDDGTTWTDFASANFFSGDPMLNHEMTGIASPGGFTWFAGQNGVRASAHEITTSLPATTDPVLLETWENFDAGAHGMGIQPVGGGLWAFIDETEIIAFDEPSAPIPVVGNYVECELDLCDTVGGGG